MSRAPSRHVRSLIAPLVLVTVVLTSCGDDGGAPRTIELGPDDDGRTIEATVSDVLEITLDSNVTTGYRWEVATEPDPAVLGFESSRYIGPGSDLVGAGGQEVWRYSATGPGRTTVELSYERPFGTEGPAGSFGLTVVVSER